MKASPAKLKDGSWGARVKGQAKVGDVVTITTSGGKSWTATITRVVWSGDGVTIAATQSADRAPASASRRTGGCCRGCGGPVRDCSHHRAMEGYCGQCAFDEFDC